MEENLEFKGTKGEWTIPSFEALRETRIQSQTHRIADVKHYGEPIAKGLLDPVKAEGEANAKLIAAAPELLEALFMSLPLMEELANEMENSVGEVDKDVKKAIRISKQAIQKALG